MICLRDCPTTFEPLFQLISKIGLHNFKLEKNKYLL